nr:UV-resistance [Lentilactobacillus senioris]
MKLFTDDELHGGVFFLIDNKSFYASCEAVARGGLNPLKAPLVVLSEAENKSPSILLFTLFLDYRLHLIP